MGVFLWKLILIKNAIAVDSSFPRFGIHFASKCVCCSSPCIERVDHLSQSDIARIDNRVSFLSQSQCGFILESSSLHHLLASWFNGAKSKSQCGFLRIMLVSCACWERTFFFIEILSCL